MPVPGVIQAEWRGMKHYITYRGCLKTHDIVLKECCFCYYGSNTILILDLIVLYWYSYMIFEGYSSSLGSGFFLNNVWKFGIIP